jgi:hypothetical protein
MTHPRHTRSASNHPAARRLQHVGRRIGAAVASVLLTLVLFDSVARLAQADADPAPGLVAVAQPLR